MEIGLVLQARVGSSRLPQKMIKPFFEEKGVFELLLDRLCKFFPEIPIFLATSTNIENNPLINIAKKYNIKSYRGSENNVLERFIETSQKYNIKNIIRICCDNPFLDMDELKKLISFAKLANNLDYISFSINNKPTILSHFGFWTEYTNLEALQKAYIFINNNSKIQFHREHVTSYLYTNPEIFKIKLLDTPSLLKNREDIRLTLDTINDFNLLSKIYKGIYSNYKDNFNIINIIRYLDKNPKYKIQMIDEIKQNLK